MNRSLFILLCAAAGLAGWGGAALWPRAETAAAGPATAPPRDADSPPPGGESAAAISRTAEALQLARSLDLAAPDSRDKLLALPPGAARDLALALHDVRAQAAKKAAGEPAGEEVRSPFADLPANAKEAVPYFETLKNRMLSGDRPRDPAGVEDPFASSFDESEISRWASLDPAAASETILKMPAGKSRTAAVDAAAKVMARDNPQAAWDLVVKSGEQQLGEGAARAWLASSRNNATFNKQLAAGLSPAQQENMAKALGDLMDGGGGGLSDKEVSLLACGVPSLARGPAQEKLLAAIAERQPILLYWATGGMKYFRPDEPAHVLLAAQNMIGRAQTDPLDVLAQITGGVPNSARTTLSSTAGFPSPQVAGGTPDSTIFPPISAPLYQPQYEPASPAVLNAAAPRLLPQLTSTGHVKEAAQILPRITDPQQRHAALESILPQWMDADPAAARAAFNAAPFTALERERWQQHPAFLLNPVK